MDAAEAVRAAEAYTAARAWARGAEAWRLVLIHHHTEIGRAGVIRAQQHLDMCRAWGRAPADPVHGCAGPGACTTVGCAYATPTPSRGEGWDGVTHHD